MKLRCNVAHSLSVIDARSLLYHDRLSVIICNWLVKRRATLLWVFLYRRILWVQRCCLTTAISALVFYILIISFAPAYVVSAHSDSVKEMALSNDGAFLATAGDDGLVRVWSVRSNGVTLQFEDRAHFVTDLAFSPDAHLLVVSDVVFPSSVTHRVNNKDDITGMRIYDVYSGHLVRFIPFNRIASSLAFSPDGKRLFTADSYVGIREWDTASWKESRLLGKPGGGEGKTVISPTGVFLATAVDCGGVVVWDLEKSCIHWYEEKAHASIISSVAFSPDGTSLASASLDGVVQVWDIFTGVRKDSYRVNNSVYSVSFSPNQEYLAVGSSPIPLEVVLSFGMDHGEAGLYNLRTGQLRKSYKWHRLGVRRLTFSPDGGYLVTGDAGGVVRFWPVPKH
jgi:WD40 repeat protein